MASRLQVLTVRWQTAAGDGKWQDEKRNNNIGCRAGYSATGVLVLDIPESVMQYDDEQTNERDPGLEEYWFNVGMLPPEERFSQDRMEHMQRIYTMVALVADTVCDQCLLLRLFTADAAMLYARQSEYRALRGDLQSLMDYDVDIAINEAEDLQAAMDWERYKFETPTNWPQWWSRSRSRSPRRNFAAWGRDYNSDWSDSS